MVLRKCIFMRINIQHLANAPIPRSHTLDWSLEFLNLHSANSLFRVVYGAI